MFIGLWINGVCMWSLACGGNKTVAHQNDLYRQAKVGGIVPVLEAAGVLSTLGVEGESGAVSNIERPADVLL